MFKLIETIKCDIPEITNHLKHIMIKCPRCDTGREMFPDDKTVQHFDRLPQRNKRREIQKDNCVLSGSENGLLKRV